MIGRSVAQYTIEDRLGEGGMGAVYLARDRRLGRQVAIKVVTPAAAGDPLQVARLLQEARAAAALNHPNIVTIHEIGQADGVDFIVMERVEGATLSSLISPGGMPISQALDLAGQIVDAVAAAHGAHVVHRDLKPANVMVTPGGRAKVLDFGLARFAPPVVVDEAAPTMAVPTALTGSRTIMGSIGYMSPEQIEGQPATESSDVFSLGIILFEMLTGRRPFTGVSDWAVLAATMHAAAPPVDSLRPDARGELARIVARCLSRQPEDRYASAVALAADLHKLAATPATAATPPTAAPRMRAWPTAALLAAGVVVAVLALNLGGLRQRLLGPPGRPPIRSLAVLPLENLTHDASRDYFADGMTEALIAELSKIGALKVISRTSVMQYKGSRKAAPKVAGELGVDALVEGSVLREGDQVRVTVQLIHGPSDAHLWAQSFDRKLTGILALYSEVARAIADEIRVTLTPQEQSRLAVTRSVNPRAYELYVLGRHHLNQRTMDGYRRASERFREALELDPGYAPAHATLADTYMLLGEQGGLRQGEARSLAADQIRIAMGLDANVAEAHTSLARWKLHYEWNWTEAEHEFKRALELNPGSATGHQFYGRYLGFAGRFEEAFAELQRARELDPLSAPINAYIGQIHIFARQYDKAGEQLERTLEIDPNHALARHNLGELRLAQGRFDDAIPELERSVELSGPQASSHFLAMLGCAQARAKRRHDANRILQELNRRREMDLVSAFDMASLYASLGETERAMEWLERGAEQRDPWLIEVNAWPWFDAQRDDPRFQDLLRRVGFRTGRGAPNR